MNDEEKQRAVEIVRRRCCLYEEEIAPSIFRNGINTKMIGDEGVEWLVDVGILVDDDVDKDSDSYLVDRDLCVTHFFALTPPHHAQSARFCADPTAALIRYSARIKELEQQVEDLRLFLFFRELANAAWWKLWLNDPQNFIHDFSREVL